MQLRMSVDELDAYLRDHFPQAVAGGFAVELTSLEERRLTVALSTEDRHLRPGGTVSGPTLFAVADITSYLCILAHLGPVMQVVTTNMSINFLQRPLPGRLQARCDILKLGKRLAVVETSLFGPGSTADEPYAHAVGTYSLPTRASGTAN